MEKGGEKKNKHKLVQAQDSFQIAKQHQQEEKSKHHKLEIQDSFQIAKQHQMAEKSKNSKQIKKDKDTHKVKFAKKPAGVESFLSDDEDLSSESDYVSSEEEVKNNKKSTISKQVVDYYKTKQRRFTVSVVVPSSIIDNAQSLELKTYLVGQIAKNCALFRVNEIIVYSNDKTSKMKNLSSDITTTQFFVQNLEYIETPQYLRKQLFPMSEALRFSGLIPPLESDHHYKITEWSQYREGVIINRPTKQGIKGSWVNIGLQKDCLVHTPLQEGIRVTVRLDEPGFRHELKYYTGNVVSAQEAETKLNQYWGYNVRVAHKFEDIFDECPYTDSKGYDLKIAISQNQGDTCDFVDFAQHQNFKHALIMFGGMESIEGIIESDEGSKVRVEELREMFDKIVNCLPERGTRTIKTEENILVSLSALYPKLRQYGNSK